MKPIILQRRGSHSKRSSGFVIAPPVGPFTERTGSGASSPPFLRDGSGLTTEKIHVLSSPDYGISNMSWPYDGPSSGIWTLRDCKAQNVIASPPMSMNGTGESGFWIGEKTYGSRLEAWNCAWMSMVTLAACAGSRFDNVDLHSNPHVGLYMEHPSTDVEFHYCSFGGPRPGIAQPAAYGSSINVEWWYTSGYGEYFPYNGKSGSWSCRFIDCEIYCPYDPSNDYRIRGAFLDAGTFDFLFERCRFWGPGNALGFPNNLVNPSLPNRVIDCVFDNAGSQVTYHDNVIG